MTKIPYTSDTFNMIAQKSRIFHNNREIPNTNVHFYATNGNPNMLQNNNTFIDSFINDLDIYIQSILYDVDIRDKVKNYISHQMYKYGKYVNKDILGYISQLDMKYVSSFKERDYIQGLLIPYLYDNVMINE